MLRHVIVAALRRVRFDTRCTLREAGIQESAKIGLAVA